MAEYMICESVSESEYRAQTCNGIFSFIPCIKQGRGRRAREEANS